MPLRGRPGALRQGSPGRHRGEDGCRARRSPTSSSIRSRAPTSRASRRGSKPTLPNVTTLTASEFDETIGSTANLLSGIIVGVGFISLIVGGLSVVNTMAMSVNERTREIGIKRAIGGTRRRIIVELVTEAGLIGFIGGAHRARPRRPGRLPRQRGGPRLRNRPLQPDGRDRPVLRRLRDRPRDGRRDHPRDARGAARSRPGPSARIGAHEMALLEAQNLRKTFHLGRHNDVAGPPRRRRDDRGRRDGRDHGAIRIRQEHADARSRAAAPARPRRRPGSSPRVSAVAT